MTAAVNYGDLPGQRVVVTGGASGVGATMAAASAEQGCRLHLLDVQDEPGAALAGDIGEAAYHFCDRRDVAAIRRTMQAVEQECGVDDALVNNAASDRRSSWMPG